MRLVVFDIDGTLTDTSKIDGECFLRACVEVCGFAGLDGDWSHYENVTDVGIFREIFESRTGRVPDSDETARFRRHFIDLLRSAACARAFAPIAGAPALLERLTSTEGIQVALATGCWADAARVKMTSAGMNYDEYPSASADDAMARETIIELAIERSRERVARRFESVVYVGDGVWDGRACRKLGIPFIGVGAGNLAAQGASYCCSDLTDGERFVRALQIRD